MLPVTVVRQIRQSSDLRVPRNAMAALASDSTVATLATSGNGASSNRLVRPSRISASAKPVMLCAKIATPTHPRKAATCKAVMAVGSLRRYAQHLGDALPVARLHRG